MLGTAQARPEVVEGLPAGSRVLMSCFSCWGLWTSGADSWGQTLRGPRCFVRILKPRGFIVRESGSDFCQLQSPRLSAEVIVCSWSHCQGWDLSCHPGSNLWGPARVVPIQRELAASSG